MKPVADDDGWGCMCLRPKLAVEKHTISRLEGERALQFIRGFSGQCRKGQATPLWRPLLDSNPWTSKLLEEVTTKHQHDTAGDETKQSRGRCRTYKPYHGNLL